MSTLMKKLVAPQQAAYIKGRCIQEQVLLVSEMVKEMKKKRREGKISPMVIRKGIRPTHLFFPDDVFMFCNGGKKTLQNLLQLLDEYQKFSGQIINKNKSKLFIDGTTDSRKSLIQDIMQMERSDFPDKYLGVILSADRIKPSIVWPMVEMLQSKLAASKGRMLPFQERLVLIKSVLCPIPIYNMAVYKWPSYVIKICEKVIRIFLWSGDSDVRKFKTVAWERVHTPFNEGGLDIPRLAVINRAFLMKMIWKIMHSKIGKLSSRRSTWIKMVNGVMHGNYVLRGHWKVEMVKTYQYGMMFG
ncbi:uncharacterized protein LOC113334652 [Papaver somniferum]|uniref:uncharacterized protein LOC113334652 n=1 Tax=Papaver somniferum TaxID=3469 RepID=UPI000E704C66|nr:uncharacterized protein LOC113334652 [Papaver somniferum]